MQKIVKNLELAEILLDGIKRDLKENEILCSKCGGLGVKLEKNFLVSCRSCVDGITKICNYCNNEIVWHHINCKCEKAEAARQNEFEQREAKKEKLRFEEAEKLNISDKKVLEMEMFYCEEYPYNNGYFSDIDDFLEDYLDALESWGQKPQYIWSTEKIKLELDAVNILENACDELHEDALSNIPQKDIKELQEFLNKWAEEQNCYSYYPDYKYAILLP